MIDPTAFERETLNKICLKKSCVIGFRNSDIFSSDGYAAGYYSYLWADVISTDAYEAFTEGDGPYDKGREEALRKRFSVEIPDQEDVTEFWGRDPKSDALMRARGFDSFKARIKMIERYSV
jgi:peptidyl-dipeptidase Dcp